MRTLACHCILTVGLSFSLLAHGQPSLPDHPRKNLLAFTIGAEFIPSQSLATPANGAKASFTQSASYALNLDYGRHVSSFRRTELWLDVPALVGPSHRTGKTNALLPASLATFYVTPSARLVFLPTRAWNPWLSAGGGYGLYETSEFFANGSRNPAIHTNTGVLQFGAGIDGKLPLRFPARLRFLAPLGFRTEFRDFYSLATPDLPVPVSSGTQHGITASGGLIARF